MQAQSPGMSMQRTDGSAYPQEQDIPQCPSVDNVRIPSLAALHTHVCMNRVHALSMCHTPSLRATRPLYLLPTLSMCHPPSLRATHPLYVPPTLSTCRPPSLHATHPLYVPPTLSTCCPPSLHAAHPLYVLPTFSMCRPPSLHAPGVWMACRWCAVITGMVLTAVVDKAYSGIVDEVCASLPGRNVGCTCRSSSAGQVIWCLNLFGSR